MAGRALTVQAGVVHRHERKRDVTRMTGIALRVGRDVPGGPAFRRLIVVTGRAPPDHR
jgi:hypothetical protein